MGPRLHCCGRLRSLERDERPLVVDMHADLAAAGRSECSQVLVQVGQILLTAPGVDNHVQVLVGHLRACQHNEKSPARVERRARECGLADRQVAPCLRDNGVVNHASPLVGEDSEGASAVGEACHVAHDERLEEAHGILALAPGGDV